MKKCSGECKEWKEASEFSSDKTKGDGLNRFCKPCNNAFMKTYYQKNKHKWKKYYEKKKKVLIENPLGV